MTKVFEKVPARKAEHPVDEIFINRWSPRAMSGEDVEEEALMSLFEAARWAPSSYNNQSWRFIYARRSDPEWSAFLGLLNEWNQAWVGAAGALVLIVSKTTFDFNGRPARTHTFDAGAAWENFALQGSIDGFVVHAMEGFDYEGARRAAGVPDGFAVEAMAAVGRPGRKEDLPAALQVMESPSGRKSLSEVVFKGRFGS